MVDRQTIVTGDEALLRSLARRTDARLESAPLDRLLSAMNPDADAMLLVDLAAVRAARWKLPTALADVWPTQKRMWHDLWETPAGLACTLWWSEPPRSELALVCESETTTERVRADLDELLPAVKRLLGKQLEAIDAMEPDKAAAADPYKKVLEDGQEVLEAAHPQVADGIVWLPFELEAGAVGVGRGRDRRLSLHARGLAGRRPRARRNEPSQHPGRPAGIPEGGGAFSRRRRRRHLAAAGNAAELDRRLASLFRPCRLASAIGIRLLLEQPAEPHR